MTTYANPGVLLVKFTHRRIYFTIRLKRLLILKLKIQNSNKQREYQQIYAKQRLFTKIKSLFLQLCYLPISELQNLNHPGGLTSFLFVQDLLILKPTTTIIKTCNESISTNLRRPAPIYKNINLSFCSSIISQF